MATEEEVVEDSSEGAARGANEKICWPPLQSFSSRQTQPTSRSHSYISPKTNLDENKFK